MKKSSKSVIEVPGLSNAKEVKGRIKILLAVGYKDGMIYVRRIDGDIFLYDAIWKGQDYSQHMIITGDISKKLEKEIASMCYAGAAATIDILRGDKMSEKDKKAVEIFESKRKAVEKGMNGSK